MKFPLKILSLLTVGLLMLSLLAACGEKVVQQPATTTQAVTYEGLTPEQIYEALQKAEDFVFITVMDRQVEGATIAMTYMLEKDGNILRYTIYQDAEDDTYDTHSVIYFDFGKNICIVPDGDEWFVLDEDSEKFSLEKLIKNCTPVELLFENDNYSTAGGKYTMTKQALQEMIGSTSATVSGKMTEEEGNYSFEVVTKEAGNTVTMTTKVLFRSVSVVMPTYNTDASTQQKPTTTVPPATTVPEEAPQPELTNAPENETNSPE